MITTAIIMNKLIQMMIRNSINQVHQKVIKNKILMIIVKQINKLNIANKKKI